MEWAHRVLGEPDLTGVATVVLVVATALLVIATGRLARITRQDGELRRIEATRTAWLSVRAVADLPDLSAGSADETIVAKVDHDVRGILREIEDYAVCVNARVFDLRIFDRMSGGWFVRNY